MKKDSFLDDNPNETLPRVIIVGAGFGGLFAAKILADKPVSVLIIDQLNYHTFTPLLYQVATGALDPSDIAYPVRRIFANNRNIRCLMGEVVKIDPDSKTIEIKTDHTIFEERYDELIIATGGEPNYFGKDNFQKYSFDLRTLDDAVQLRNHILRTFEKAAWLKDSEARKQLTTYVVIGGGPTGLETAGALYELLIHVLESEYTGKYSIQATIYLVELGPNLLGTYPPKLQRSALKQIRDLGINVILENGVEEIMEDRIKLQDRTIIPTNTVIWAAGVQGRNPLDRARLNTNRILVKSTMEADGFESVYVVGDTAFLPRQGEKDYPMMVPVAQQQGILAANNILRKIRGKEQESFKYFDRGIMATIGRKRAVAWIYNRIPVTGFPAWFAWLTLHLITLIGFRNKLIVLVSWIWNYFTFERSVRIILD